MPVAVMTAEEQNAAISQFESTLNAILEEKGVSRDVQATLARLEILTCETFAVMESTAENMRVVVAQRRCWTQLSRGGQSPSGQGDHSMGISSRQGHHATPARCLTACCRSSNCDPWWIVTMRIAWEANMSPGKTLSPWELPAKSFI